MSLLGCLALVFAALACAALAPIAGASPSRGLVLSQLGTGLGVLSLLCLAGRGGEAFYFDVPLLLAVLATPAALVYAHFLRRWDRP